MYRIVVACNAGIGTSAFASGLLKDVLSELPLDPSSVKVECTDLASAKANRGDLVVTQKNLVRFFPQGAGQAPVIGVASLVSDKEALKQAITPYLEQGIASGKIRQAK